jgi:4-amino-4-deoxy-L-arabinose transferase-like glycosyltransferase
VSDSKRETVGLNGAGGLLSLWLLAVGLALLGLGSVPLRDWDEGIVARVALELANSPWPQQLLPTYWGDAYRNKPPGLHGLLALLIRLWRQLGGAGAPALPPEALLRLGPALLSSALVPLLALVQRRLLPQQGPAPALASALVALTLLPLARHGRLVMLDGTLLSAMALLWWGLLLAQGPVSKLLRGGLLAGLATSALLLLKAPVALPVLATALLLRWLDRDLRGRAWGWLLVALALGLLPGLAWHGWHGWVRGPQQALEMWTSQGVARLGQGIEGHGGGPWPPLLEVLKGGWPWLPLWPFGIALAWRERRSRWGRWVLGLTAMASLLVLPLQTQLPWYSLLLWPPFCLALGPVLVGLVRRDGALALPGAAGLRAVPRLWCGLGVLVLAAAVGGGVGLLPALRPAALVALPAGLGLLLGGTWLAAGRPRQRLGGLIALASGFWLSLALLFGSPLWLWELNELWPVKPAALQVQTQVQGLAAADLHLWRQGERPSLNWYLARRVPLADGPGDLQGDGQGVSWLLSEQRPQPAGWDCQLAAGVGAGDGAGAQPGPGPQAQPGQEPRPGPQAQQGQPTNAVHLWRCQRR